MASSSLAGTGQIVKLSRQFGHNAADGVRAAVDADQQHRHQHRFPTGQEGEVGPDRPHGRHHPHHERQVARRILDGHDPLELGQSPDGGHVDRAGKHGDVVERHVDGAVQGDLAKIGVDRFGAQLEVERRDDGHGPGAVFGIALASRQRLADVGLGGPGQHGHPAGGLLANDLHDPLPLLGRETGELAGGTVGIKPVHAVLDQPVHVAAQFRFMDRAVGLKRHDVRRENPLNSRL